MQAKIGCILITITLLMIATLGFNITPSFGENHTDQKQSSSSLPIHWVVYMAIAAGSIVGLLVLTNSLHKPTSFGSLPIYLFFALTIFVIFFILSISFLPLGDNFPISTTSENQAQWTLNIGSVQNNQSTSGLQTGTVQNNGVQNNQSPSGLQIPMFVIIAGILGAYIRYLYIGISEFKESFQEKLNQFEESRRAFYKALDSYNAFTGRKLTPWPILGHSIFQSKSQHAKYTEFEEEVTHLNDEPPLNKKSQYPITKLDDNSLPLGFSRTLSYTEMRRFLWSKIRDAETNFKKHRFIVSLEITTHILKTVGSFFLGPLLAVLAWLLLSISGTDGTDTNGILTFALVSFAIGLTTKTIISKVMSFVGEKMSDENPSQSNANLGSKAAAPIRYPLEQTDTSHPSYFSPRESESAPLDEDLKPTNQIPTVSVDPIQARAGQLLIVRGKGFRPNSFIDLQYYGNGNMENTNQTFQTSSNGTFGFELWLPSSTPTGDYHLSAKDHSGNSAREAFRAL